MAVHEETTHELRELKKQKRDAEKCKESAKKMYRHLYRKIWNGNSKNR